MTCRPSEDFSAPYTIGDTTFQLWRCTCGQGIDAQISPQDILLRTIKQHLKGEWPLEPDFAYGDTLTVGYPIGRNLQKALDRLKEKRDE